ncbi:MAG: tetratricopeptide repeat protein [Acidobacteriia bacterium]|nr:tetratricopeptide repeat protein [Terriglobia bacterium]
MRVPVISLLLPALIAVGAAADVIHLKNGRTIWADHVSENGARVEYDVGEDSYAIPKSSVERIEAGGVPPQFASQAGKTPDNVPAFAPSESLKNESGLADKIIHDHKVDTDALAALEQGDATTAATGYFLAGKYEFERGNFSKAGGYFERALRFDPQNPTILNYYAALLVRTGNPAAALGYAERAVRLAPDSPDALAVLGYAQFASDRNREAIRSWKRSLDLRPDPTIQQYLDKAQREAAAEADFTQNESNHFTLRYEGKQTPDSFRRALMETLESDYDDLSRELGGPPRSSIAVVLYTDQAFFDVTQAPSWSGAVNDGKLRIPVQGVDSVTSDLAHVLKHELAHSFINQLTGGRCPQWLNEGVAQALEPKSVSSRGRRLAELFQTQHEIPFNTLEGSFMRLSPMEAVLAYDESLAAVEYINDTYGMSDVRRILERLGEGSSTEAALRATIHSDYGQLESEVGKYLISRYGD